MAERYPRLVEYLASLPAGLASYPDCQAKTSLSLTMVEGLPEPRPALEKESLPEPLARFLRRPPTSMWSSEVESRALALSIADHYRMSNEAYLAWIKQQNRSYFGSLMYRAVMAFASPAALVAKAAARWAAVHRGSSLAAKVLGPGDAQATLTFPPFLFAGLALLQVKAVLEAGAEHTNARHPTVELEHVSPTSGVYRVRWET